MSRDDLRASAYGHLPTDHDGIIPDVTLRADLLAVTVEQLRPDVVVVRPRGNVDIATHDQLRDAMLTAASAVPILMIIDLDGVEFLASSGLAALLDGQHRAAELGVEVALAGGRRATLRVLELTGLLTAFRHGDSVPEVLDLLG